MKVSAKDDAFTGAMNIFGGNGTNYTCITLYSLCRVRCPCSCRRSFFFLLADNAMLTMHYSSRWPRDESPLKSFSDLRGAANASE